MIVEGAEKPVMRAVAVEARREVKVVRRVRKFILEVWLLVFFF